MKEVRKVPTAKPTNEIIRIAEDTVNLPSTGKVNKQVPSYDLRTVGYDKNKRIFAEELNYTLDNIGAWCQWFETRVDELQSQIEKERVSVGELIEITGDATNPSVLKGYGTWEYFGEGLTTVGVGLHTDDRSETKVWEDGDTEGEYQHLITEAESPSHSHSFSGTTSTDTHSHGVSMSSSEADGNFIQNSGGGGVDYSTFTNQDSHNHTYSGNTSVTGGDEVMNNTQPSVAVYRWKRVS